MTEERNGLPELPQGWVWTTVGEITQPIEKVQPKENPNTQFTYLDISSIDNQLNRVVEPKTYYGSEAPSRARQLIRANDVLFSTVRTYLKNIALVPEICDGQIASTGFSVLRGESGISSKYLFYYSLTDQFLNALSELQRGTSYPAVRDSDVRAQPIPLPPLAEQQRVVAKIEELFTQLDAGVVALEKAKARLRRYRQAVLKVAVEGELTREWREAHRRELEPASVLLERILEERRVRWEAEQLAKMKAKGKSPKNDRWKRKYKEPALPDTEGLPELPEGWCYTSLAPLLSMHRSGMKTGPFGSLLKKHEHRAEGVPVLGIENVEPMRFVHGNKIHVTEEKAAQLSAYDVQANDILISRSGTVGQVCVVPEGLGEARMSTNLMRVVLARDGMLPHFFSLLFNGSPFVLAQVSELCSGSTRDFLNQKILSSVVFSGPPLAEQQRIVSEVERRLSVADEMEKAVEQSLKRAERLRQSILKRAFEGKLVPQDASDEPASVLLERIKAEKARREGERKGRKKGNRKKRRKTEKAQQLKML